MDETRRRIVMRIALLRLVVTVCDKPPRQKRRYAPSPHSAITAKNAAP